MSCPFLGLDDKKNVCFSEIEFCSFILLRGKHLES